MIRLINVAKKNKTPVTFRAGGTSLSGQAVTDSILLKLGHTWRYRKIDDNGKKITVEPGWILGQVNRMLAPYGRKLGPDPSSIDSCWIGGVVANNSSGMCCGVAQNTYHTIKDLRIVLHDGTILDTADASSWASFQVSHKHIVDGIVKLSKAVKADKELSALITKKFSIKCTTGYSINALVDFENPLEIIKHLMVGSEGTLGFVSRATYHTVEDHKDKASAFIVFATVDDAANATALLREAKCTDAVELFDRRSLKTCENMQHMTYLRNVPDGATALLVECRGENASALKARMKQTIDTIETARLLTLQPIAFLEDPAIATAYWDARKALIPMVAGMREGGTSVLLEDVAVPVRNLAKLCRGIEEMYQKYNYADGSAFGHALEGNLHLVFTQSFDSPAEVKRYEDMMDYLCKLVVSLDGSLKAEHGTGRNVAPYVEMEWGAKATGLMWEVKALFDPDDLLNPGVVLNRDSKVHVQNLKPMPVAHEVVDTCMECGFCESACPSGHVTLTPRQRIVATRELARLDLGTTPDDAAKAAEIRTLYGYQALDTCAADGMCAEKCPVSINTGRLVKDLRARALPSESLGFRAGSAALSWFSPLMGAVPTGLNVVDAFHGLLGTRLMSFAAGAIGPLVGLYWHPYLARGASRVADPLPVPASVTVERKKVVYFATCVSRSMGPARGDSETASIHTKVMSVLAKAGYDVILPSGLSSSCCGLVFDSRGLPAQGETQLRALEGALATASEGGKHPVLLDTSPCVMRLKDYVKDPALKQSVYEPAEFASKFLLPRLSITPQQASVAMHVPCSGKKMKVDKHFEAVMLACASSVTVSPVPCCGMAGDRGLRYPEISGGGTSSAVAAPPGAAMVLTRVNGKTVERDGVWPQDLRGGGCSDGYSTSRTCEMSLSKQTETHFKSLFYILDKVSKPLEAAKA